MPDGTTVAPSVPTSPPEPGVPAPPAHSGTAEVLAHLVAAFVMGSVAPFVVLWTSPGYAFGVVPGSGFELVEIAPQLVAVVSLGLALLVRILRAGWLREAGWLVAAVGLAGLAGLYAQGATLDGQALTILLVLVISLQIVGLLVAFARAPGLARWAVAVGLAAGITGGRDAVVLTVLAVKRGPLQGSLHGDDVVFAGLALIVAVAGVVLLFAGRARRAAAAPAEPWPAAWWSVVRWPLAAVVLASVLAVVLTRVWNARLDAIAQSFIGGISEQEALAVQTGDQLVRVATAVVIAAVLVAAAQLWSGPGVARWVLVAFGTGLVLAAVQSFLVHEATWLAAGLGVAGAATGAVLVRVTDRALPWDAVGLVLATLLIVDASAVAGLVGAFGFGLAVAAGIVRLAPAPDGASRRRLGPGGVSVAAALGLAAWVLCHQVVVPAAAFYRADLGDLTILPAGVLVAAAAGVVFFLVDGRRRPDQDGADGGRDGADVGRDGVGVGRDGVGVGRDGAAVGQEGARTAGE